MKPQKTFPTTDFKMVKTMTLAALYPQFYGEAGLFKTPLLPLLRLMAIIY